MKDFLEQNKKMQDEVLSLSKEDARWALRAMLDFISSKYQLCINKSELEDLRDIQNYLNYYLNGKENED